jgi:hypothetical protein
MPPDPRRLKAGKVRVYNHLRLPSAAARPCTRPSPVRAITVSAAASSCPVTSLDSTTFQRGWPVARSIASNSPLPPPANTSPSPAPAPADSFTPVSVFHTALPLETAMRATRLPPAANTSSPSASG